MSAFKITNVGCLGWLVAALLIASVGMARGQDYQYTVNADNTITITRYTGSGGAVIIPSTINGKAVTCIGEYCWYDAMVGAFYACTNLTSVTIPYSVTNIVDTTSDGAFCGCSKLTAITVDTVNTIYSDINGVLFNKNQTTLVEYPLGNAAGNYTIPNSVVSIGASAFQCTALTNVTIGSSVKNIGGNAFSFCTSLTSVTIPDGVTNIGYEAFYECYHLTNVTFGNGLTSIGRSAFYACTNLTSVTIPNSVTSIGQDAFFNCNSLTSVMIPGSVTDIGEMAFANCTSLAGIYFLGNAPSLGSYVFAGDNNATVYYFPWTTGWGTTFGGLPTARLPYYLLTIITNGYGTVTGATNGWYVGGMNITLTANPSANYHLVNWTGTALTGSDTNPALNVNMDQDKTITANFTAYLINATAGANGSISPSGMVDVVHGSNCLFTLTPNTDYQVTNVKVDGSSIGATNSYQFNNVTASHTISVTFWAPPHSLFVVSPYGTPSPPLGNNMIAYGSNITCSVYGSPAYIRELATNIDGFETGDFSKLAWTNSGDAAWMITTNQKNSGLFCARSGLIGNNQSSTLELKMQCTDGNIVFWRKVSSEPIYDKLTFCIDGLQQGEWSGTTDGWNRVSYPVVSGVRVFTWTYSKDDSKSNGVDTAWIDDVAVPIEVITNQYVCTGWIGTGSVPSSGTGTNTSIVISQDSSIEWKWIHFGFAAKGTPVAWLDSYGLSGDYNAQELADPDNDGCPTWQEYIAGTDPTNSASCFKINSLSSANNEQSSVLYWQGVAGRLYSVYSRTNLLVQPWITNAWQIPSDGSPLSYTNSYSNPSSMFFRLGVEKP